MLFDLRARGRRRTVQTIYVTLAVLMGGGLIFFGIGGGVSGGLLDGLGITSGGQGESASAQLEKQEKAALRRTRANPNDAAAWAAVTRLRYQQAGQGDNFDQETAVFTSSGRRELAQAAQAWSRHLALKPDDPDANVAALMVQAFSPLGLNRAKDGVAAAEIVADARPSSQTFYQLALFAFAAGQNRKAELAGQRAVELAPEDQRKLVKSQVDEARKNRGFPRATGQ